MRASREGKYANFDRGGRAGDCHKMPKLLTLDLWGTYLPVQRTFAKDDLQA
ncbi:hypothetical protein SAMN05444320_117101 [Streptoalloteichus hindustanus]|uniref:Uncharacterized protein n=1 Tax=Streptoalloteichus hindustanus TaxID=2017 RepID=A0A1M5P8N5_STRHI|nr:hypothetical protein SAMN05444320_117101 [Streptoalloteichus hindustanus]